MDVPWRREPLAVPAKLSPQYKSIAPPRGVKFKQNKDECCCPLIQVLCSDGPARDPVVPEADEAAILSNEEIPLSDLPPLPKRGSDFMLEPLVGVFTVLAICALMLSVSHKQYVRGHEDGSRRARSCFLAVCAEVCLAVLCLAYLLFGTPRDQIIRSRSTCFPMPVSVMDRLQKVKGQWSELGRGENVEGPKGHPVLGTYCVRCFVWRPPVVERGARGVHHCSTCQRCYTGFDHHCGVFGRCIVQSNLPYFWLLIGLLPAALVTILIGAL